MKTLIKKGSSHIFFFSFILAVLAGCSDVNDANLVESNTLIKPNIESQSYMKATRSEGEFQDPFLVNPASPEGDGTAFLIRNKNGISVQVHSTGLAPGHSYTAWFIVFEDGAVNFANPPFIVVHAAGNIVGGSGNSTFSGSLSTGPIGDPNGTDILMNGDGNFDTPESSAVVIHIVDHGPAGEDGPGTIPENIHEFTGADGLSQEYVFIP